MNLKSAIIFFFTGAIFGVILNPFSTSSPSQLISSPITNLYANQNRLEDSVKIADWENNSFKNNFDINEYFDFMDKEQQNIPSSGSVLASSIDKSSNILSEIKSLDDVINYEIANKTIAIFGDSMVDTMETNLPYLSSELKIHYPNYNFTFLNYGIGAENIGTGISRVNSSFSYKDRNYQAITSVGADIIILGTFAYNPYQDDQIAQYEKDLINLIQILNSLPTKVILLAEIAPLKASFGDGPNGINWDDNTSYLHATKINSYLEKAISVAQSQNIPIIDLYHQTIDKNGEGIAEFVNPSDGIHPSQKGHQFIASQISAFLTKNKLI